MALEAGLGTVTQLESSDDLWARISSCSPGLRKQIRIYPHAYRGKRWYVFRNDTNGAHLRLDSSAYQFIGLLDGKRSVDTVYEHLLKNGDESPSKPALIELLSQLIHFGALRGVGERDAGLLIEQYRTSRRHSIYRRLLSPLVIRFPLFDPDRLLGTMVSWSKPLNWSVTFGLLCLIFGLGLLSVWGYWPEIKSELDQLTLKPVNFILLWFLFPVVKIIHEFAHGLCIKRWGGEVNEMGITLLVFTPVPYVDASATWSFRSKYKRMMVSAAGVITELCLASLAIVFWTMAEPGFARDCAFGVVLICSVSTVVFNANPLLKFDGYYVLQDWLEIPNLHSRSSRYLQYLTKRYLLRTSDVQSPVVEEGEPLWLVLYGLLAGIYRIFLLVLIVLMLASKYLVIGILVGMLAVYQQLIKPVAAAVRYLRSSQEIQDRGLAYTRVGVFCFGLAVVLTMLPFPSTTRIHGVVWVPSQGEIFTQSAGFVDDVFVAPGELVQSGEPIMRLSNHELDRDVEMLVAEIDALTIQASLSRIESPAIFSQVSLDLESKLTELAAARQLQKDLIISANTSGRFVVDSARDLRGRHYSQGDLLGHVINHEELVIRAVVPESRSAGVLDGIVSANVRLAESPSRSLEAEVSGQTPSVNTRLPAAALGAGGGGSIAISMEDDSMRTSLENLFHVELTLPANVEIFGVGERAYVSLRHKAEPLASRWFRSLQQLFLKTLS